MTKPKTIACDKCGHRMESIPEKCPECGEIIHDRMEPHLREKIDLKLRGRGEHMKWIYALVILAVSVILANAATCLLHWIGSGFFFDDLLVAGIIISLLPVSGMVAILLNRSAWQKDLTWIFLSHLFGSLFFEVICLINVLDAFGVLGGGRYQIGDRIDFFLILWTGLMAATVFFTGMAVWTVVRKPVSYILLVLYIFHVPFWLFILVCFVIYFLTGKFPNVA